MFEEEIMGELEVASKRFEAAAKASCDAWVGHARRVVVRPRHLRTQLAPFWSQWARACLRLCSASEVTTLATQAIPDFKEAPLIKTVAQDLENRSRTISEGLLSTSSMATKRSGGRANPPTSEISLGTSTMRHLASATARTSHIAMSSF